MLNTTVIRPFDIAGTMNEPGSESCQDHVVTLFQTVLVVPECQRDSGRRCVAIVLDVDDDLLHRHFQAFGHCLDDAHIGLVGDNPLDVVLVQMIALGNACAIVAHVRHGITEHRTSLLIEVVQTVIDGEIAGRTDGATGLQVQERQSLAIAAEIAVHATDFLLFRLMGNDYTIDYNTPPSDCPSLWCDWYYDSATKEFKPSDGKTYEYIRWLEWLIKYIFNPADIKLNGEILWQGEDILDRGIIHVKDNVVETMT